MFPGGEELISALVAYMACIVFVSSRLLHCWVSFWKQTILFVALGASRALCEWEEGRGKRQRQRRFQDFSSGEIYIKQNYFILK